MFCPECGTRIDEAEARFCPQCGTCLDETAGSGENACPATDGKEGASDDCFARGFILTNCRLLAGKVGTTVEALRQLLDDFIGRKQMAGVDYRLLDVDGYTYCKRGFLGWNKKVSLQPDSPWADYLNLLEDAVNGLERQDEDEALYLFIIGSNDIIPMPCVPHPVAEVDDTDIDTDLLWAYPYGEQMVREMESLDIFHFDQQLLVGRLPVGKDTGFQALTDYLHRDLDCDFGIPLGGAYAQCDPHWKRVSAQVSGSVAPMLPNLEGRLTPAGYYRGVILSPDVLVEDLGQVFNPKASIYYFNLHGSNAPEAAGYYGCTMGPNSRCYAVMQPGTMRTCRNHNVVTCEACYGARHRGMDSAHSTLLSALYGRTLLFVGSSRIAWGDVDALDGSAPTPCLADTLAATFMGGLLEGYTAGEALFYAKAAVMRQDSNATPHTAATLLEFNLFGDPTLYLNVWDDEEDEYTENIEKRRKTFSSFSPRRGTQPKEQSYACRVERIGGSGTSLLDSVRTQVDANIEEIHRQMSQLLYSRYGLAPRPADAVLRLQYADGRCGLRLDYAVDIPGGGKQTYTVIADTQGRMKRLYASK